MRTAKIIGYGSLLTAVVVVAGLWLIPFTPRGTIEPQHCVPILEVFKPHPPFAVAAAHCHFGSVDRVTVGAGAGILFTILGLVVLLDFWISSRSGDGREGTIQDGQRGASSSEGE